jgi:hypothetical protein
MKTSNVAETDLPPDHHTFALSRVRIRKDDHPAFAAMVKLAKELPLRDYVKDLTFHDRNALRHVPRERGFAWMLRPTGATLFWQGAKVEADTIASASEGGAAFWWDGVSLTKRTPEQVKERLDAPSFDGANEILKRYGLVLRAVPLQLTGTGRALPGFKWSTGSLYGSRASRVASDLRDAGFVAETVETDTKDLYQLLVEIP